MKNWVPSKKLLATSITVASLGVLLYVGALVYLLGYIRNIENFYSDADSGFAQTAKVQAVKSIVASNGAYIDTLRQFFVKKGDEVQFIENIEMLGREAGVAFEISSIKAEPDPGTSFKENITVGINTEGSWTQIISFINKLEKAQFGAVVSDVRLEDSGRGRWSGDIKIQIFREL